MHTYRGISKRVRVKQGIKVLLEIKQLVSGTIRDRNDRILSGEESFGEAYIENFNKKMTELLGKAEGEAAANTSGYSGSFERALIARIIDYQENYSSCAVAIRQVVYMQFIAMKMTCRISNPFINEQNVAASADTRVRQHGFCELMNGLDTL